MTAAAALALALLGFAALALSMHRHHRDILGASPRPLRRLTLRAIGWTMLALALAACIAGKGWAMGPVLWFALLTLAALAVTTLATLAAQRAGR